MRLTPRSTVMLAGALGLIVLLAAIVGRGLQPGTAPAAPRASHSPVATSAGAANGRPGLPPPVVAAAALIDDRHGWAVTADGLRLTSDGGASWATATPTGLSAPDIAAVDFLDQDHGWVVAWHVGGTSTLGLRSTADGGATWVDLALPKAPFTGVGRVSIVRIDPLTGWLTVSNPRGDGGFQGGDLFRTIDGGATWGSWSTPIDVPVTFADPLTGWLTGGPRRLQHLMSTGDGGRSWTERTVPLAPEEATDLVRYQLPRFFDRDRGVLPVLLNRPSTTAGNEEALMVIYRTSTGGRAPGGGDWEARPAVRSSRGELVSSGIPVIVGLDDWLVVQPDASIIRTSDAGTTWETIEGSGFAGFVAAASFSGPSTGWVVAPQGGDVGLRVGTAGILFATQDGGRSWSALDP